RTSPLSFSVSLSLCLSAQLLCLSVSLPLCLSVSLSLCLSASLPLCLSASLSLCLSALLTECLACLSVSPSSFVSCQTINSLSLSPAPLLGLFCLPAIFQCGSLVCISFLSVCLPVCLSVCLPVCLSVCLP